MCPLSTKDLHRIFQKLDKNNDGLLSLEELSWLLERIGINFSLEELQSSVGKSSLNLDEFLLFYDSITKQNDDINGEKEEEEQDLAKAFNVFDLNGDGFISCEELQSVLARLGLWDETSGKDCRYMIHVYDTNLDGVLDFQEFKNMMLHAE
ncbi:probable calcium-binding protein CML44 [Manihot esculenta]|uniref:EF-hand domain-containing protein n=1 Tax=Manihot esculenta TaxID=3983 RepID=A0A2C9U1P9_MANES|nr:probable calcium-binding protein CML44 [Manihot esculenta]OAY23503.1 hypothetical protein MANES_18G083300v8 [Manihot esculenta]